MSSSRTGASPTRARYPRKRVAGGSAEGEKAGSAARLAGAVKVESGAARPLAAPAGAAAVIAAAAVAPDTPEVTMAGGSVADALRVTHRARAGAAAAAAVVGGKRLRKPPPPAVCGRGPQLEARVGTQRATSAPTMTDHPRSRKEVALGWRLHRACCNIPTARPSTAAAATAPLALCARRDGVLREIERHGRSLATMACIRSAVLRLRRGHAIRGAPTESPSGDSSIRDQSWHITTDYVLHHHRLSCKIPG